VCAGRSSSRVRSRHSRASAQGSAPPSRRCPPPGPTEGGPAPRRCADGRPRPGRPPPSPPHRRPPGAAARPRTGGHGALPTPTPRRPRGRSGSP
jgi:hypothetical protein